MVNPEDIKKLINHAEVLCECIEDQPVGCEACWLFDEEAENFECPLKQTISTIKEQL